MISRFLLAAASLVAALGVMGCSVGGPVPIDKIPLSVTSVTGIGKDQYGPLIYGSDGEKLRLYKWDAVGEPKAVVVTVHGYGDHSTSTFTGAAELWREAGAIVYAYDQRGFGRNRSRGAWPGPQALIDDLAAVLTTIADTHPELPLVLMGHSMGGGVTLATLGEGRAPMVDAAVLIAPGVYGGDAVPWHIRALIWVATATMPDRRLTGGGLVEVKPTDNVETLRTLAADPWYLKYPSPREYLGVVRLMDRAVAAAPTVETPLLMLWGENDVVIPEVAIRNTLTRLPEEHTTYVQYPEGWHLLLRDVQGPKVRQDIWDWVETTLDETRERAERRRDVAFSGK